MGLLLFIILFAIGSIIFAAVLRIMTPGYWPGGLLMLLVLGL